MTTAALPRARPRRRWIWVLVALVTVVVVLVPAGFRVALKAAIEHATLVPVTYHRSLTSLQVDDPGGSITVSPSQSGQVRLAASVRWLGSRPVLSRRWQGSTLSVSAACPPPDPFGDCQTNLEISVPAGTQVVANAGAGGITVTGLTGPVDTRVTAGSIVLADLSGPVRVSAGAGSVTGTGLSSGQVSATVGSGWLSLGFTTAPHLLALTVGAGSVQVTVPPGTGYRVIQRLGAGSVELAPGLRQPGSPRRLTVHAGVGSVTVTYPQGG